MQLFHISFYIKLVQPKARILSDEYVRARERAPNFTVERPCFNYRFMLTATVIRAVIIVKPAKRIVNKPADTPDRHINSVLHIYLLY